MANTRLSGKVALVTGAMSGIGQGCAQAMRNEGALVIGVDRIADDTAGIIAADLTDEENVTALTQIIRQQHSSIDILVNAAASAIFAPIEEMSLKDWRATLIGELDIVFLLTRAMWPLMKQSGNASIVNFSSANARHALEGSPALAHCAGKGGVLAMTRQLAMEGAPYGIRANTIAPGFIVTAATRAHLEIDPGFAEHVMAKNMIKRLGKPDDIAACVIWLASDEAGYVTGADIAIDGGATAW
ncbi:MAG: SDR family oxidoreductase [Sphingobium sp.]|nr:SDR family oxidoreductase [Sphingobium sp.]